MMSKDDLLAAKIEAYNGTGGSLDGVDCAVCRNKGYVADARDGAIVMRECACMAKRRSLRRMRKSGLLGLLNCYTFDAFRTPEPWQKQARERAIDFAANGWGRWFVITGTPGTGKTHLCTAIAGAMLEAGREVRYMLWRTEAPRLKAIVNDREEYEREINQLKEAEVLYIDDFFKGSVSDADINLAFELLGDRYNKKSGSTMLSSEKTVEELLDIDEAIGSRIYEMSKGYCLKMPKKNWKQRGLRARRKERKHGTEQSDFDGAADRGPGNAGHRRRHKHGVVFSGRGAGFQKPKDRRAADGFF